MKKEESTQLKEGQTVYIAVKYLGTTTDGESAHVKIQTTDWMDMGLKSVVSISPNVSFEHIVIPSPVKENKPKYDPCRLLRKGDKVQVVERNGRCWGKTGEYLRGAYCFVLEDEERNAMVKVRHNCSEYTIEPAYLELVTPVEELEQEPHFFISDEFEQLPYFCLYFGTKQNQELVARLDKKYYTPEAAEAECARLNEQYRKEQK